MGFHFILQTMAQAEALVEAAQLVMEQELSHGRVGEGATFVHQGLSGTGYLFLLIGLLCMAGSTAYFYMAAMKKSGDEQFFRGTHHDDHWNCYRGLPDHVLWCGA